MSTISVLDLERDPGGILRRVQRGEALLIVRDNEPIAEIKPARMLDAGPRPYGLCAGDFAVPSDFNLPLPENVVQDFDGA